MISNLTKYSILTFLFLFHTITHAQFTKLEPVTWQVSQTETNGEIALTLTGDIDEGWYIYSMFLNGEGPTPTALSIDESDLITLIGEATESATKEKEGYDNTFEIDVKKLLEEATLTQKLKLTSEEPTVVKGYVLFQVCNEEMCLPPTEMPFGIEIGGTKSAVGELAVLDMFGGERVTNTKGAVALEISDEPINDCSNNATAQQSGDKRSYWGIFLLGILGGLVALLTPCVFPMIPLTVTFFTKQHDNKSKGIFDAVLYGFSIFMIYFLLALPFLIFKLPQDTLYRISTNPILNLAFFVIFIFFAISLFGFFELTLPSKWANKTDAASNKGGIVGIFFMAITLAIVSFSCTGPILGSLLAGSIASEGGQYKLVAGMSGFGVALGLPFALFAMFPGMLKKLPKSGSWMNTVKVCLAFVELGLAMKFLSNADLVNQWGLINYPTFLILWIVIALALAAYLFGFIRFPHDMKGAKIGITKPFLGILCLAFAGYLGTGLMGKSMGALSGFFPPKEHTSITSVKDINAGIERSQEENKPILVDFTGWSCVNCRLVEQNVWPNPEVAKRLKEDVVLVSLYADDRTKLSDKEVYFSDNLGRTIKTIGGKWTDFEAKEFGQIAQPLYALITPEGELLNAPIAFTTSVEDYLLFLDCGIATYKELNREK